MHLCDACAVMAEKKKRGVNYSVFEKEKLADLIEEHRVAIEEKSTM